MQSIFIEDRMSLPSGYFENGIVCDCVKLLGNVILQSLFSWQENSDTGTHYNYAQETSPSFSSFSKTKA